MKYCFNRDTATTTVVEQRNLDTAATEFQRRFHISADDEGRHRNSVVNQVSFDFDHNLELLFLHNINPYICSYLNKQFLHGN